MSNAMTLADLLARDLNVETHEAVAVVRAVADRVLGSADAALAVPDLSEIVLSPDGQMRVTGATRVGEPVRRLGQLLQAMLVQSSPPVQVRLVISQATAPEPLYGTVQAYSEALAYFERPDRTAVIRALHARAVASAERPSEGPAPTLDAIAPLSGALPAQKMVKRERPVLRARRAFMLAASAVCLLVALIAAVVLARSTQLRQGQREASTAVVKASDALGTALVSGVSAVSDRVGLGRLVAAEAESAPAPVLAREPRVKSSRTARTPAVARITGSWSVVAFDLDWAPKADPVTSAARAVATGDQPALSMETDSRRDDAVYAPGSEGVAPPVGRRPQLPTRLPDNLDPKDLGRIELVILENGTVESVRLLSARPTVHDAMMLSAAKTWEFSPALKDGRAVKYRKIVWTAVQ